MVFVKSLSVWVSLKMMIQSNNGKTIAPSPGVLQYFYTHAHSTRSDSTTPRSIKPCQ